MNWILTFLFSLILLPFAAISVVSMALLIGLAFRIMNPE
jgi:hypothetical protein